jgi:hypothetical protein
MHLALTIAGVLDGDSNAAASLIVVIGVPMDSVQYRVPMTVTASFRVVYTEETARVPSLDTGAFRV